MRFGALTCIEIASLGASKIRDSLFVLKPIVLEQVADSFEGANSMWLLPLVVSIPHTAPASRCDQAWARRRRYLGKFAKLASELKACLTNRRASAT